MSFINGFLELCGGKKYSGRVTLNSIQEDIGEAEKIMLTFVKDNFGKDEYLALKNLIETKEIGIDYNSKKKIKAYYSHVFKKIYLLNDFAKNSRGKIDIIKTIIHEYAHMISSEIAQGEKPNRVIEESFANILAEMAINDYIQKGNSISTISEEDNELLKNDGYYENTTYIAEGDFSKSIMYLFRRKGFDMELFREYYFGSKSIFLKTCVSIYGKEIENILINKLGQVKKKSEGGIDSENYLPSTMNELNEILFKILNLRNMKDYIRERRSGLYNIENNFLNSMFFDKLEFEFVRDLMRMKGYNGINNLDDIDKLDLQTILRDFNVQDLHRLSKFWREDIIEKISLTGHSNFTKKFVSTWYTLNKNNFEKFDQILPLVGNLPIEVLENIINDYKINDFKTIVDLAIKYRVISNKENYDYNNNCVRLLLMLNRSIGSHINEKEVLNNSSNKKILTINENMLYALSQIGMQKEDLKNIFEIYGYLKEDILDTDIYDVVNTLKKFALSYRNYEVYNGLKSIKKDIISILKNTKIRDLNLLKQVDRLYEREDIPVDIEKIDQDIELAIINLAINGYKITNTLEIREKLYYGDFRKISIEPRLNRNNLKAFIGNYDQTNILFNMVLDDFLTSKDLLTNEENLKTCMLLFSPDVIESLGIDCQSEKRIYISILNGKNVLNNEKANQVINIAKDRLIKLSRKDDDKLNTKRGRNLNIMRSAIDASLYRVRSSQIITSQDLIKKGNREKLKNKYHIDY